MTVAELVTSGKRRITTHAVDTAAQMNISEAQIWETIRRLAERGRFCRTIESTQGPGQILDEWKSRFGGQLVYIKLKIQIDQQMKTVTLCVLSFSKNEEKR